MALAYLVSFCLLTVAYGFHDRQAGDLILASSFAGPSLGLMLSVGWFVLNYQHSWSTCLLSLWGRCDSTTTGQGQSHPPQVGTGRVEGSWECPHQHLSPRCYGYSCVTTRASTVWEGCSVRLKISNEGLDLIE